MPLLRPNIPFPVCPRCKAVLPHDATFCAQCGYRFQAKQTTSSGVQQESTPGGYQFNQANQAKQFGPVNQASQANQVHQNHQVPYNGMLPGRIPVNQTQGMYQNGLPVNNSAAERMPVPEMQAGNQAAPHTPYIGNMQAARLPVTGTGFQMESQSASQTGNKAANMAANRLPVTGTGLQMGGYQVAPQAENRPGSGIPGARMQAGYPFNQTTTDALQANRMPSQGMQPDYPVKRVTSNRVQSVNISPSTQPRIARNTQKDKRSQSQTKRALLYFFSVILATALLVVVVFNEAGQSLFSLISHPATTHTVTTQYPLPKGTPLFLDTFLNDASGWNLQSVPGSYQIAVGNGKMALEDDKNSLLWELLPGEHTYDNFILSVDATLTKGDPNNGYGVYIRGTSDAQSDLATYYRFELYGDSSYAIFKGVTNQGGTSTEVKLTNFVINPAIQKLGKLNHLMVIAKGPQLSFIVNGQLLTTIKDASYASGSMALFVSNLPGSKPGAQAQFSQLAIYPK